MVLRTRITTFSIPLLMFMVFLVGCTEQPIATATEKQPVDNTIIIATDTSSPSIKPTNVLELPTETSEPPTSQVTSTFTPGNPVLPPEPKEIEFIASDGQVLKGTYYPAAINPAPLVVLMHWAGGDKFDWVEIAYWLQNRGLVGQGSQTNVPDYLDPTWFPVLPKNQSYAIFTFTFRDCEGGCKKYDPQGWLLDAQAAMLTASQLEGIDTGKIVALGASIGADGAIDGCSWLNSQASGTCVGAISLSPGSYLGMVYAEAVATLESEQPAKMSWCLYAIGDQEAAPACLSATGSQYELFEYAGNLHGMQLLMRNVQPETLQSILIFLEKAFSSNP